jgi:hypothetical protein
MKIRPVGAGLFHAEGRTDEQTERQTDMTKLIQVVAFRNFANASPKYWADTEASNMSSNLAYLLSQWSEVILEKLTAARCLKKFTALHGRSIALFTTAGRQPCPKPVECRLPPHVHFSFDIHFNNILPSTAKSLPCFHLLNPKFCMPNPSHPP